MMPPMTRKASTRMSSAAITSFVLVSMGGRMMHKVTRHRFSGVTRRCDVDQAPRGPLARRTHLTGRRARSARREHTARSRPLWGATRGGAGATQMAPALQAFEQGAFRRVGPTAPMAITAAGRGESEGDHAIGPATAAKDQRPGFFHPFATPCVRRRTKMDGRDARASGRWASTVGFPSPTVSIVRTLADSQASGGLEPIGSPASDGGSSASVDFDAHAGESRAEFRALLLRDRSGGRAGGCGGRQG